MLPSTYLRAQRKALQFRPCDHFPRHPYHTIHNPRNIYDISTTRVSNSVKRMSTCPRRKSRRSGINFFPTTHAAELKIVAEFTRAQRKALQFRACHHFSPHPYHTMPFITPTSIIQPQGCQTLWTECRRSKSSRNSINFCPTTSAAELKIVAEFGCFHLPT